MTSLRSATQSCPNDETLAAFLEGRLGRAQLRRVGEHLRACEACSDLVERYAAAWQIAVPAATAAPSEAEAGAVDAPLAPGRSFARFVLLHLAGRGGMADVHAAYDPVLDRRVALKLLHAHDGADARARMLQEARTIAALAHPHIVAIYDVGHAHGRDYIAMELVDGGTLAHWLAARPRSEADIVEAFRQAGLGLAAAHAHGVVHRDFKPANVLIGGSPSGVDGSSAREGLGRVRVTDFGLARPRGIAAARAGTRGYVAPEQAEGAAPDPVADQYSFCVALREALGGGTPAVTESEPGAAAPRGDRGRIGSRRIAAVIARGMQTDPRRRFASMSDLVAALAPPRRRWLALAGTAAAAIAVAPFLLAADPTPCPSIDALHGELWGTAAIERARAAFAATELPYADTAWTRARGEIDARVDAWADRAHTACTTAVRDGCVERERIRLQHTIAALGEADATTVTHASDLVAALDDDACREPTTLPAIEPIAHAALLGDFAAASALRHAGHQAAARSALERVIDRARELGDTTTQREAQLAFASLLPALGRDDEAVALLGEVAYASLTVGDDATALDALTKLVSVDGAFRANHAAGARWDRDAQAVLARLGDPLPQRARLERARAAIELDAGDYTAAIASMRRAFAWTESIRGAEHLATASARRDLGLALYNGERLDEAREHLEHALAIRERELGDGHPDVASCTDLLFAVELAQGDPARALAHARRSVAIYERAHGTEHLDTINARMRLGTALESVDLAAAREAQTTAVAALSRVAGDRHPHVASARMNLAQVELALGRYDEALATARTAHEALRALHGDDDVRTVGAAIAVGSALRFLGRLDEARPWLTDALTHSEHAPPGRLAAASDALGRLELDAGNLARAAVLFDAGAAAWTAAYGAEHPEAKASRADAAAVRARMPG